MRFRKDNQETHQAWNLETIELLSARGSKLDKIHSLINVFYSSSEGDCESLQGYLAQNGFGIVDSEKRYHEGSVYWSRHAEIRMIPRIDRVIEMTNRCVEIADEKKAEYDGWYTEVVN